jgi:hypothetical protein
MTTQISDDVYVEALAASRGLVYAAAKRLGCSPQAIYKAAKRSPKVKAAIEEQRGLLVDMAELGLAKAITDGDMRAIIFTLKTLGKERGYVERGELEVRAMADWRQAVQEALADPGALGDE